MNPINTTISPENMQMFRAMWERQLRPVLTASVKSGIGTFARFLAAQVVIPDHAVKTKQELHDDVQLSQLELALRKAVVPMLITQLISAPSTAVNIGRLLTAPGVESKLRATAALLKATPGFFIAYKTLVDKYKKDEVSFSPKEIINKDTVKPIVGGVIAGHVLDGYIDAARAANVF